MAKVETHVYGIYPKTENLRKNINRWERGKIETGEIYEALRQEKEQYFTLLDENKIATFTDPLFNWYDVLRPIVLLSGGSLGPLTRYKENNTFYRLPEFEEVKGLTMDPTKNAEVESNPPFPLYQNAGSNGFSAFLPSPVTIYRMSQVSEKIGKSDFINKITDNYLEICRKFGVKRTTIFESFEYGNEDISFLDRLSKELDVYLITEGKLNEATFKNLSEKLYSVVVSKEGDISLAAKYSKVPGVKLLDAHNTKLERVDSLKKKVEELSGGINAESIVVTNSDYYDFLPRSIADRKVEILSQVSE
ncbi:MAG TPA: hypothetical protein VJ944_01655 [Thermoplasmataceae archaeon]|nr:hypothetical protein [Thermoplasmataceae archaeon]